MFLTFFAIFCACLVIGYLTKDGRWWSESWSVACVISGIILCVYSFMLVIHRVEMYAFIERFEQVETDLDNIRTDTMLVGEGDNFERAGIAEIIVEWNTALKSAKYWNDGFWLDWHYPDEIDDLEYLR